VSGKIDYPATPEQPFTKPLNIVWLVAESWRADVLTPQIMPITTRFAQKSQQFLEHYSGGNGTRMGMFSQFYGLYGSYWFDFLSATRPPLMMEMIRKNGYAMQAYTSSRFSYPEFDKTIFAGFADSQLQSFTEGAGWERDRKNVGDMLQFIESAKAPFFSFMFFESAHANYYFPDESVIESDYIEDFNYLTVDIENSIERIRARYINATHHLDSQLGRVFDALEAQGLLDTTIVIVTGDHGEEFMENGRWGHNSTFSQEQIRVPLLVHVPGQAAGQEAQMTSHLDLPATVLAALGVDLDPDTYSYGSNLLAADYARDYTVASDWHGNTLITPDVKMVFSKKGAAYDDGTTTLEDEPVDIGSVGVAYRNSLNLFARELARFYH
jgi:membrane-anchored protein YejM (alkaline phosphatase superfamily)